MNSTDNILPDASTPVATPSTTIFPRLINELIDQNLIYSPQTHAAIKLGPDGQSVISGDVHYKIKNGVIDLYGEYQTGHVRSEVDDNFVHAVCRALNFPESTLMLEAVAAAVGDTSLTAKNSEYSAEIAELADRLGIADSTSTAQLPLADAVYNRDVRVTFERMFLEPILPRGQTIRRSLRIRNDGRSIISSDTDRPVMIAYHWLDANGKILTWDGRRSAVLRTLAPGEAITVICEILTPEMPGVYRIQFQAIIEGERWVTGDLLTLPVVIDNNVPTTLPVSHTGAHYDYAADHAVGMRMIVDHIKSMPVNGKRRFLEVGGGVHPQAASLAPACDIVAIDISFAMSQLGQLHFDYIDVEKRGHVAFVTCDAHDPPFPEGTFDGVIMFAALHHFADPKRLLANLRRVLKPNGFVAIMCEPFGPDPTAEAYLRDLRKGINEQCWTVSEHGEIFIASGLKLVSGQLDGGSLKVILSS